MIGLRTGVVELSEHCNEWNAIAASIMERIHSALGSDVVGLEHVGSTSITGIPAKPIIDLALVIGDDADRVRVRDSLKRIGFEFRKRELSGKELYRISSDNLRECLLHLMPEGHPDWPRYILFRDRLNSCEELRDEYASLKHGLAERFHRDPRGYVAGKADFVSMVVGEIDEQNARSYFDRRWPSNGLPDEAADRLLESAFYGDADSLAAVVGSWSSVPPGSQRKFDSEIVLWHALRMGIDEAGCRLTELYGAGSGRYASLSPGEFNWTVGILIDEKVSGTISSLRQL